MNRIIALTLLLTACGGPGPGSSPEATFASYLKAAEAKNMKGIMSLVDPDRLPMMAMGFLGGAQALANTDAKVKAEYEELKKKYGFGDPQAAINGVASKQDYEKAAKEFLRNVSDLPGLCADIFAIMNKYATSPADMTTFKGKLSGVKIVEDTAQGVVSMPDGKTIDMKFVRRNGVWYINPGW
jgi:hypothetical protein